MLVCLRAYVLACLAYFRVYVFLCLRAWCACVITYLTCLLISYSYALNYHIYLLCSNMLNASVSCSMARVLGVLICSVCYTFEKLKSKNSYLENLSLSREIFREIFRTHLNIYDGAVYKQKLTARGL